MNKKNETIWKIATFFLILQPLIFLFFPGFTSYVSTRVDANRHIVYTQYLFFDGPFSDEISHMENYPALFHQILYLFSFGLESLLPVAYTFLTVLAAVLFRYSIYRLLTWLDFKKKAIVCFIVFSLVYLFSAFIPAEALTYLGASSVEMMTMKVGLIPSFVGFSLGVLSITIPWILIPATGIVFLLSRSAFLYFLPIAILSIIIWKQYHKLIYVFLIAAVIGGNLLALLFNYLRMFVSGIALFYQGGFWLMRAMSFYSSFMLVLILAVFWKRRHLNVKEQEEK